MICELHDIYWGLSLQHSAEIHQSTKVHSIRDSKIGLNVNANNYPTT